MRKAQRGACALGSCRCGVGQGMSSGGESGEARMHRARPGPGGRGTPGPEGSLLKVKVHSKEIGVSLSTREWLKGPRLARAWWFSFLFSRMGYSFLGVGPLDWHL